MTKAASVTVRVNRPRIEGDTVWFTWSDDAGLPVPPEGGLFYRFETLDLSLISDELWMEVFLALRLGTCARLERPVIIKLPVAVPGAVVDYWRTYHGADLVEVTPQSSANSYSPLLRTPGTSGLPTFDAAVYFGGGRESLAAACLLGEIYGRERVLLIQCVDPFRSGETRRQSDAQRFGSLSLAPARETLGFATQCAWTNLHDVALSEGGRLNEPHLQQYTAGLLPVLLLKHVKLSTPGYHWHEFFITPSDNGNTFRYPRSRPEMLAAESLHRRRVSGIDHEYVNVAMTYYGNSAFSLLARRYPDAFPFILSCVQGSVNQRWCHECKKCGRHAWHHLQDAIEPTDFSLDRMMSESVWIRRFLHGVAGWEAPPPGRNSPFTSSWAGVNGFGAMCESLYCADPGFMRRTMQGEAWINAVAMQTHYGNRTFPAYGMSPSQAYDWFPPELGKSLRGIVSEYAPIVDKLQPLIVGENDQVVGPFDRPFDHPLLHLPHLQ